MNPPLKKRNTPRGLELTPTVKPAFKRIKYDHNPFLEGVVSTFSDKRVKVAMKPNLAEIDNATGEYVRIPGEIVKVVTADNGSFVKLYSAHLDAFFELTGSARQVVKYLVHTHQLDPNKHLVGLHRTFAEQAGYEIPESSWFAGIRQLIEKDFIASATVPNYYYLNPALFFNGDRTRFVVEIKKQRKIAREVGALAGPALLEGLGDDAL
jgi:hypothetical protein